MNGDPKTATAVNLQLNIVRRSSERLGLVPNLILAAIGSIVAIGFLGYLAILIRPDASSKANAADIVRVYCAAGVAQPIKQLADSFNDQSNYLIEISRVGGSGELAGQIKLESESDMLSPAKLFITNDEQLLTQPSMQGIFESQIALAIQRPVIAVAAQSPKKFNGIPAMLQESELKFGVASKRAAVGSLARKIAADHNVLSGFEKNKSLDAENVMVLAQALVTQSLDAAVVWDTTVKQINEQAEAPILKTAGPADPADKTTSNVTIAIAGGSNESMSGAKAFAEYLKAKQFGGKVFKRFGFEPIEQASSNSSQ